MLKSILYTVGPLKTSWIKEGCAEYAKRIARAAQFEIMEIPAGKQKEPAKQREEESEALLKRLEKVPGQVWVLDETGEEMGSQQFSKILLSLADQGEPVTFVLGGAYGLTDDVRERADRILALSQMTLPHELCRLVFLEQLYRAQEIGRGSGYHH